MNIHQPQLNKKFLKLALLSAVLAIFVFGLKIMAPTETRAASGINTQLNYQGKLTSSAGTQVSDASWNFRFRIYSASSGGTLLWTERWTSTTTRAATVNGIFSVALDSLANTGDNADLLPDINWNSDSLYLQVDLDADNNGTWEESFDTRKRLTSSAYAFNADMLDGYNATTTAAASSTIPVFDKNLILNLFSGGVSSTWATSTNLYVGANATTTNRLVVGSTNPTNNWGGLWVGGNSWFNGSATTTGVLTVNEYATTTGGFFTQSSGWFGQSATSSKSLYVGSQLNVATTSPWAGYEFALTGNQVLTGNLFGLGFGQFNNVSTTDTLYAGGYASTTGGLFTQSNLRVGGNATTTNRLVVGSVNPTNNYGSLWVGGNAWFNGVATTTKSFWIATTTNSETGVIYSGTDRFIHRYGGLYNTFVGRNAGNFSLTPSIAWGNTGVGEDSLKNLSTGERNTALGHLTLLNNSTGSYNTAQGHAAMQNNFTGSFNTAQGIFSLYDTTGSYNTAQGAWSLSDNSTATSSVGIGAYVLQKQTTGAANTALGFNAGWGGDGQFKNITGKRNVFIGWNSGPTLTNLENSIAIGASSTVALSNALALGGTGSMAVNVGLNTDSPFYQLHVNQLTNATTSLYVLGNSRFEGNATTTGTLTVVTSDSQTATANMYIDANGLIHTATSARRFKTGINYSAVNSDWVYQMKPVAFTEISTGNPYIGFIAEDMAAVDPRFASYDSSGQILGVEWNAVASALTAAIQNLHQQVSNLSLAVGVAPAPTSAPLAVIDNPDLAIDTLVVRQAATFYGTIYVRGQAGFESRVVFNDDIEVKGKIYASPDQAGTAVILANATSTEVVFAKEYQIVPKIVATARKPVALGIIDQTIKGFRVFVNEPVIEDLIFDWLALAVKDGLVAGAELPHEPVLGCLDAAAGNYNPSATQDDGSCEYPPPSAEPVAEPVIEPTVEPVIEPAAEPLVTPESDPESSEGEDGGGAVESEPLPTEITPVEPAP